MIISTPSPKRGDIWLANFDPTVGAEIKKVRLAVVISSDGVGKLPIKLIAPITDWKEYYAGNIWHVKIEPDTMNSLSKASTVDVLQLRGMDVQRFIRKIGQCSTEVMEEIAAAIAAVVEYS
ncbi:type II toxin-antitoxin system PemK/MazF family toxin [Nostoc sp. 106C]|uniref:type II toxin-antitoxin system PemK/MazF family toxin n=1 Tax=Nostoc sp. 106C TaxID=1932667 RepID=UPI000A382BAA|nr:type II toxin-antitoxin system PemK/MazF family toxin [Nostoc sp. 106C]OUL30523.1 PemK family transcriptional regulator [Nostoc sp. 106C]